MKNVINVDFKRRMIISGPSFETRESTARDLFNQDPPQDMFSHFDHMIQCIEARFGDELPSHGPIYKQTFKGPIFDTYGHGCAHNSIHQYRPKKNEPWNRPIPFPADLRAIETYLKKNKNRVLRLGKKSDPFMWLDGKYSVTKSTLELANKYNVSLVIHTMSDLCACPDYLELIKAGGHSIVMQMGFGELIGVKSPEGFSGYSGTDALERIERMVSPGAASILRRKHAIEKLKEAGVEVREQWFSLKDLTKEQKAYFEKATGSTVEYWIGEQK